MPHQLPTWFEIAVADVRADCHLRPENFTGPNGDAAMDAEIVRYIPELGEFVLGELRLSGLKHGLVKRMDDDLAQVLTPGQKVTAIAACRLLIIAALFGVTPDAKKLDQAKMLKDGRGDAIIGNARFGSAESLIKSITAQFEAYANALAGDAGAGAESIQVERDRPHYETEYEHIRRRINHYHELL